MTSKLAYTATPWTGLNRLIGGWTPGRLYVLASRTGGGKSLAGLQAAVATALAQIPACYVTTEQTRDQTMHRVIAQVGPVDLGHLTRGGAALTDDDRGGLDHARQVIRSDGDFPLYLVGLARGTLDAVRAAHAETVARCGPAGLLVVDSIQGFHPDHPTGNRREDLAGIASGLKDLAGALDVPVLATSQGFLSAPALEVQPEIRDAADVVLHLDLTATLNLARLSVVKHPDDSTGETLLFWDARYTRLLDPFAPEPTP